MNREVLQHTQRTTRLGITASRIDSVRSGQETKTVVRLYDGGTIGVASAVGEYNEADLDNQAEQALSLGISYPVSPNAARREHFAREGRRYTTPELVAFTQELLTPLRAEFPQLLLSYGVTTTEAELSIRNDLGLDLSYTSTHTEVGLVAKEKGSPNIIDTFAGVDGTDITLEGTLRAVRRIFQAYANYLGKPESGHQRVVFAGLWSYQPLFQLFQSDCTAPKYAKGSSVFAGRIDDEGIGFHENFRLVDTRDHRQVPVCPFDLEGTLRAQSDVDLVRGGALRAVAASRKDAARYELPATGSAIGKLTHPPLSGIAALRAMPTAPALRDLLDGEPAILVWFQAGGNCNRRGDLAIPAMTLFKVDGEGELIGRLDPCTLSGNLYTIFGEDFVGVSEESINPFANDNYLVTHLTVQS
jgi:PmbA protein